MTVTLTYDSSLSRIQITANGLNAATSATVERSTDGLQWTAVRGGTGVPVSGGVMSLTVSDYEFVDGVANTYRVRGAASGAVAFVGVGTSATGNNTSVTPGLPASVAVDDLVLIHASIRNVGTGVPNTPTNWTVVQALANEVIFGRVYDGVWTMPTVSFTGGAAGADTLAESAAFRRASIPAATAATQVNASAQNVAFPAMNPPEDGCALILAIWKQDDWTSVAAPAGWTLLDQVSSTAGSDAAEAWWYQLQTTAVNISAGSVAVTGGAAAVSQAILLALPHADWINQQTAQITPNLGAVWLKDIGRPFLNRPVTVEMGDDNPVSRKARGGVFDIVDRSAPVSVSDIRGSRSWTLQLLTSTSDEADAIDLMLSTGDPMFVHVPAGCQVLGGYVRVGDTTQTWHALRPEQSLFTLPLTVVAAPGPDVVGSTATWTTVLAHYATWSALIADKATWVDVLNLIGDPTEVIVP